MKKTVFWLSVLLFVSFSPFASGTFEKTVAARGCCLQRAPNNQWYRNGMSFEQCRSANENQDHDDLYSPIGWFWWNVNC